MYLVSTWDRIEDEINAEVALVGQAENQADCRSWRRLRLWTFLRPYFRQEEVLCERGHFQDSISDPRRYRSNRGRFRSFNKTLVNNKKFPEARDLYGNLLVMGPAVYYWQTEQLRPQPW